MNRLPSPLRRTRSWGSIFMRHPERLKAILPLSANLCCQQIVIPISCFSSDANPGWEWRWDTIKSEPRDPLPAAAWRGIKSTFSMAEHDFSYGSHLSFSRLALQSLHGQFGRRSHATLRQDLAGHATGLLPAQPL